MEDKSILIIDDEEQLRSLLKRLITLEGFHVWEAGTLKTANAILEKEKPAIVLCDVKLPDGSGLEFIQKIKQLSPASEIILLTAYGNIPDGIQAMKNGAFDYIVKGDDNDRILPLLNKAIEKISLEKKVKRLEEQVQKKHGFDSIIGKSPAIVETIALAKKVAATDTTVLLLGETGTGKEVFAQAIRIGGKRKDDVFLALNCSAFGKELLESELFGHKAGAFTGATKDKKGLIEEANHGTLFLDEIAETPLDLQAKLLRVLESNEFIKVGDTKPTQVNVRIIAATNRDLQREVQEGKFREDLFYRLNVFTITLPPLRERKEDIPALAQHYLRVFSERANIRIDKMSASFLKKLEAHDWKGNIRELKNIIERAVIIAEDNELDIKHLPFEMQNNDGSASSFDLAHIEKLHIQKVLHHTQGNKTRAAELLNIGVTTLYRKIEEYKITTP